MQALRGDVLQAMDAGLDGSDVRSIALPGHAGWVGYRERHGFNVQRAWRELESEWMDAGGGRASPASAASVPDVGR